MQSVEVGESVPLVSAWWDAEQQGVEPSAITLTITAPDGTQTVRNKAQLVSLKAAPETLDTWQHALDVTQAGVWRYTFLGTVNGYSVEQSGMLLAGTDLTRTGPCEPWCCWTDVERLCPDVPGLDGLALGTRESLIDVATGILYSLDGRRFPGICEATRRICRTCGSCPSECCCVPRRALDLGRRWPVWGVWDVVIDGVTLPSTAYQLRDRRYLDRLDGDDWPRCSDLTDPDAFSISWAYGRRPPVELRDACAYFVGEMAKSCLGLDCALPQRVTSVSREGVNYTILDSQKFIDEGRTGVYQVDLALAAARAGRRVPPGGGSPLSSTTTTARVN